MARTPAAAQSETMSVTEPMGAVTMARSMGPGAAATER